MTTNFTHLINENADMFDDEFFGIEEDTMEDTIDLFEDDGWEPTVEDYEYLQQLKARLVEVIERCGMYGEDEFAEAWGAYSDYHKDIFNVRPHWFFRW